MRRQVLCSRLAKYLLLSLFVVAACTGGCSDPMAPKPPANKTPVAPQNPAATRAKKKIEDLGGYVDSPEAGHVDLTAWRGSAEDVALLSDLTTVTQLHLKGAAIQNEAMRKIAALADLRHLSMTETGVNDEGLAALAGHKTLEELTIDLCPVTDAGLRHVAAIPNLKKLTLSRVEVKGSGLGALENTKQLERLKLVELPLETEAVATIGELGIRALDLYGKGLSDGVIGLLIKRSPHLQGLAIVPTTEGADELSAKALEGIGALRELEWLCLIGSWVTDEAVRDFAAFQNLKALTLQDTSLTDAGLAPLARLHKLEGLNLSMSQNPKGKLTDAALEHFRGLKKLQFLSVMGNGEVSEAALLDLRDRLPVLETIAGPTRWARNRGPFQFAKE